MKSPRPFAVRRVAILLLFVTHLRVLAVSGPKLTVQGPRGGSARLAIEFLEAEVLFHRDLAEELEVPSRIR